MLIKKVKKNNTVITEFNNTGFNNINNNTYVGLIKREDRIKGIYLYGEESPLCNIKQKELN